MARATGPNWMDDLPFVLLSLRSAVRDDHPSSPVDLVYGGPIRLPGSLVDPAAASTSRPTSDFVDDLSQRIASSAPAPVSFHRSDLASRTIPDSLRRASFVYVRHDAVRRPLVRPYDGPFRVLRRNDKVFVIMRSGSEYSVSIDRLKPAFTWSDVGLQEDRQGSFIGTQSSSPRAPVPAPSLVFPSSPSPSRAPVPVAPRTPTTRSGRPVRLPARFRD